MIPNVFALLNVAPVNAFVDSRIFGAGHAGDSPNYPYITWQLLTGSPLNLIDEVPNCDKARVQINCWSRSETEVRLMSQAVRDVMDEAGYQVLLMGPERDPVTKSYRIQLDYSLWTSR